MKKKTKCEHDYANYTRKGRARYHCPKCDADISLEVILMAEAEEEARRYRQKQYEKKFNKSGNNLAN